MKISALGDFVEFVEVKEKGLNLTNDDIKHGKIISIGELVKLPIKIGDTVLVSTVKKIQDLIDGEMHYFVSSNAVIKKI